MVQFEVKFDSNNTWKVIRFSDLGPKARFGEIISIYSNKQEAYSHAEMLNRNISSASYTVPSAFIAE